MFICRACKGEQRRLFSSVRTLRAEAPVTTRSQTTTAPLAPKATTSTPKARVGRALSPPKAQNTAMAGSGAVNAWLQHKSQPGKKSKQNRKRSNARPSEEDAQALKDRTDMEKFQGRVWREGDVYAPHDLGSAEMSKWKRPVSMGRQKKDVCDTLGINPLHHYKNFSIMSEYMTEMGRIKSGNESGLRPINQRRMAKAIRRAVSFGLMPSVHRHPEILRGLLEDPTDRNGNKRPRM